jgi:SOS-response transcriptional repressor LexA
MRSLSNANSRYHFRAENINRETTTDMATKQKKKKLQGTNFVARNLQWLMQQEQVTQQGLGDATGVGQSTINRILTGRNLKPRDVTLHPLAIHFGVTMDDLKTKDLSQGSGLVSTLRGVRIPMVSSKVAGKSPIRPDYPDRITVYCNASPAAFAMDVCDDAMEPRLHKGDRVVVEPNLAPHPGNIVAVRVPDHDCAIVRKYRGLEPTKGKRAFEVLPLVADFPTYSSRNTEMQWLGVCIERHESLVG